MAIVLWLSLTLVAFSYAAYPLVLLVWDAVREAVAGLRFLRGGTDRRAPPPEGPWPRLSLIVAAFDEEGCIGEKVLNSLGLDYPPDRLEIVVGCDGCTDRTASVARAAGGSRVKVAEYAPRAGKATILTRLVPRAEGDVVLLTDANTLLEPGAAKALVRRFRDPEVGAVVGLLRMRSVGARPGAEGLYWKYETALKHWEGKHGCVLGANGGLYAIRRLLFAALRGDTIVDDFVIPARIAARGWKVVFDPEAIGHEETAADTAREFGRHARIGAGNWQAIGLVPELLDPRTGFLCYAFLSHKLIRWIAPLLLVLALAANVALVVARRGGAYGVLLAAQIGFYALALRGGAGGRGRIGAAAGAARHFVAMNAALAVGLWRFLRGTQRAAWDRTERAPRAPASIA